MGPDDACNYHRSTLQVVEYVSREEKELAEGNIFVAKLIYLIHSLIASIPQYVDGLKEKEREEREARLAKIRPALRNMLKGNPAVYPYSTFDSAELVFASHPIWQQAKIESERRMIFEEYVAELKQREIVSPSII